MAKLLTSADRSYEYAYTEHDFQRARALLIRHARLRLSDAKRELVYNRLSRRVRATGAASLREYLDLVENDPREAEEFVNALTTNLTAFFREPHHFDVLARAAATHAASGRAFSVWCAACSSGEEAYSIAMTLADAIGLDPRRITILASDIDTTMLKRAARGIYDLERIRPIPPAIRVRYLQRGTGRMNGLVRICEPIRSLITFARINLLEDEWPFTEPFDAVFARNVLIYFERSAQLAVLQRFRKCIRPDGLLFTGHSESLFYAMHLFTPAGRTVYRPIPAEAVPCP
jgi:chemotaxis protein methyltransferase CheR